MPKTYDCHIAASCCSAHEQVPASTRKPTAAPWLVQMQARAKGVVESCYPWVRKASGTVKTAQHSTAQHSTAQHSTAQQVQRSTARHGTGQRSAAQHSTAQHSTAQHSTAQHSTAQHSAAQRSTALPPDPSRLSAQRSKLQPRMGVFSHRQHQRTDRQQSLPHFHIPLDTLQSASPHRAKALLKPITSSSSVSCWTLTISP